MFHSAFPALYEDRCITCSTVCPSTCTCSHAGSYPLHKTHLVLASCSRNAARNPADERREQCTNERHSIIFADPSRYVHRPCYAPLPRWNGQESWPFTTLATGKKRERSPLAPLQLNVPRTCPPARVGALHSCPVALIWKRALCYCDLGRAPRLPFQAQPLHVKSTGAAATSGRATMCERSRQRLGVSNARCSRRTGWATVALPKGWALLSIQGSNARLVMYRPCA